jgi:hypothetical protein
MIMFIISVLNAYFESVHQTYSIWILPKKAKNKWKSRHHMFIHCVVPYTVHTVFIPEVLAEY